MELKELCEKTKEIFEIHDIAELREKLLDTCMNNRCDKMEKFCNMVNDLSADWMQMIFQYYDAGRKDVEVWDVLVNVGYAEAGRKDRYGGRMYWLTREGLDWLGEKLGIQIWDEED